MALLSLSLPPLTQSIFKTHQKLSINNGRRIWKRTTKNASNSEPPAISTTRLISPPHSMLRHLICAVHISPQNGHHSFVSHLPLPPLLPHRCSPVSSLADQTSTDSKTVVVKGRVQGVFYRNWTVENAKELGLQGWVRNRQDGSVEALFSGSSEKVQEMEHRCRRGPPAAVVTAFEVSHCTDDLGTGFERRSTL